ncbi:uncharacterized protein LOC143911553 [Arctopsyche grandis]|uniref:uncharacterized protein LOC143911553 n=1 Tax=Arctopsyche grandis TaxID=121162 RepID=UPI00406D6865
MYYLFGVCLLGIAAARQPDAPHHSADQLPDTEFSCRDKVLGGYYADPDAQCQMFHVCVKVAGVGIQDFRFLCPNGTAFDQEAQICAGWADVACEPSALYYSSDNFDLYRIGSGFESKKAPVALEDEPDFHLQRAEPDIFSGAHSSNFFNNREGKENQEAGDIGGQKKNQVDQHQRKKVVKKLQRRPTESAPQPTSVQPRQFTNNFAGSYVPTTTRPTSTTSFRTTSQPQYNNNNNNYYQRTNNQSYRQPSSTSTSEQEKFTQRTEQVVPQSTPSSRYNNRVFKSRTQSTPESNYNSETEKIKNKQTTIASNNNYSQYNKDSQSSIDNSGFNSGTSNNYNSNQPTTSRYNNIDRKQSYENQQTSAKTTYNTEPNVRYDQKLSSPQYNNNNNQQKYVGNYEQTTLNYNYNTENDKRNYNKQESTYYSSKSTPQTTPQYNQQYNNNQQSSTQFNFNAEDFEKIKPTTKFPEKKQQFNVNKQSTPQYNYNNEDQKYSQPQTPKPKYNTNLQYDNNQQSTPLYTFNTEQTSQSKNNQPSTYQQPQQSTSTPVSNLRGGNFNNQQFQQKSTNDYQQYSNNQQQTSTSDVYQQANVQKSSPVNVQKSSPVNVQYSSPVNVQKSSPVNVQKSSPENVQYSSPVNVQYSTARPSTSNINNNNRQYEQKATAAPFRQHKPDDYDDGQYHPELYEREAGGHYDTTARQSIRNNTPPPKAPEPELLKTAHSINIAASGNQLARENKQQSSSAPATTQRILYTQAAQTVYTTTSPKSVYSSFAAVTSAAPRPFSARPVPASSSAPSQKAAPVKQVKQATIPQKQKPTSQVAKSNPSAKSKDVSYDYAYYDNSDHYSEYDNIEEFGRTSKKQ